MSPLVSTAIGLQVNNKTVFKDEMVKDQLFPKVVIGLELTSVYNTRKIFPIETRNLS